MALAENNYVGNGSAVLYSFTFPYLLNTDIKVSFDGVDTTAYTFANATTVQFNAAPTNGTKIRIYRVTSADPAKATFYPGSTVRAQDLNANFNQVLYNTQETVERRLDRSGGEMFGNIAFTSGRGLIFEGATDDANETTLLGGDPTADRTLNLPNSSGNLVSTGDVGTVATSMIADSNVTTGKIANSNVTTVKIADQNVTTAKIADSNVTTAKIADGNVTTVKIADGNVTTVKIADQNVTTAKIADGNVTTAKIADQNVTTAKIADSNVTTAKIADQNVTTTKIADGNVTTAKIADQNVTTAKIADSAITSAKIADGTIVTADLANNSVSTDKIIDQNVTTGKVADGAITSLKIADGTIVTADLADNSVTTGKIVDANITAAKLSSNSVETAKVVDQAITTSKIQDSAVTSAKIADGTIVTTDLANNSVSTDKIIDQNVTTAKVADLNVTTAKLANQSVTNDKIANGTIELAKLANSAVVTNAEVAGATVNDSSVFTTSASDLRYFRQDTSETIFSGDAWSSSDQRIASTAAIDKRIIDLVDDIGGFVPIANETSFPATNPDINNPDGAGTIISIKQLSASYTPSSGTVSIPNGAGAGNTVTLTGVTSNLPAGFGVLVETTPTQHTYSFHRLTPKATEVTTVAGSIQAVQTAAANVVDINNFSDLYQISPNAPTTRYDNSQILPGDLWFDTISQVIKAWRGNNWAAITPNQSDLNDIAVVANDLSTEDDLGSITDPLLAGQSGGALETCGNSIAQIQTVAGQITPVNNVATVAGISTHVSTVSGIASSVTAVSANSANINSAVANQSNINSVVANATNINAVAGSIANVNSVYDNRANINAVAGSIANVNYVGGSINNVNRYAAEYTISATQPASPTAGRLWYDTVNSILKYFNGSIFASISAGISQIQSDTTPTLGGHLNANNKNINNVATIDGADLTIDFGTI
jgi:hypothetical protein